MASSVDCFGKHRVLGRYYVAAMLFIVNTISTWRFLNMQYSLRRYAENYRNEDNFFFPAVKNWTQSDFDTLVYADFGGKLCIQVPAALLIYLTSSHKFLTATVAISSIIHMLTPVAVSLLPRSLTYMMCVHNLVLEPHLIGVLSMWKDWAPPGKRMKFVFLSFSSLILSTPFSVFIDYFSYFYVKKESFYISGACGLVWSLVWYFTVTDTPANNPKLPSYEEACQQSNTYPTVKNRPKVSDVPWKDILKSNPIFALCLIYFKIGSSSVVLSTMISNFAYALNITGYIGYTNFHIMFAVLYALILFTSTIAADMYIVKYPRLIRDIRKSILCAALVIHGIILLGTLFHHIAIQVICFCLSYFIYSTCLAGFLTNALDLSSRYVAIIGGFIESFSLLGVFMGMYYCKSIFKYIHKQDSFPYGKFLLYEVGVTLFVAVVFMTWGSMEEQPWSSKITSDRRQVNAVAYIVPEEHELRAVPFNV